MKKLTLKSPIVIDGKIANAGDTVKVEDALAANLIYRGKAVEGVIEPEVADDPDKAEADKKAGK